LSLILKWVAQIVWDFLDDFDSIQKLASLFHAFIQKRKRKSALFRLFAA